MQSTLRWPGTGTLQAARNAIRAGERVEADGGAELLGSVATVAGLEEMKKLGAAVRRAHYTVRVTSPEPRLMLLPPEHEKTPRRR